MFNTLKCYFAALDPFGHMTTDSYNSTTTATKQFEKLASFNFVMILCYALVELPSANYLVLLPYFCDRLLFVSFFVRSGR